MALVIGLKDFCLVSPQKSEVGCARALANLTSPLPKTYRYAAIDERSDTAGDGPLIYTGLATECTRNGCDPVLHLGGP